MATPAGADHSRERVRERCESSLFWTAWYICGYDKLSIVLHYALASLFEKRLAEGHRRFLTLIPRGHFKTSLLTIAWIVHLIIKDPNVKILLVMHSVTEATKKGRKIKSILLSDAMRHYFPERVPPNTNDTVWSATEFTVPRTVEHPEATVTLAGAATGVTGGHYHVIVLDDLVDHKASNSAATMAAAVDFYEAVDPLFEDESSILSGIGTLWPGGPRGFYERQLANETITKVVLGWQVDERWDEFLEAAGVKTPGPEYIEANVLEPNRELAWQPGQPILPELRTIDGMALTLKSMGSFKFAHQYLNVIQDTAERKFNRSDLPGYDMRFDEHGRPDHVALGAVKTPLSRLFITTAMDPTGGRSKSDDAAITTFGWHQPTETAFLLDYWQSDHPSPKEQIITCPSFP